MNKGLVAGDRPLLSLTSVDAIGMICSGDEAEWWTYDQLCKHEGIGY